MKYIALLLIATISFGLNAMEQITITPENAEKYKVKHTVSDLGKSSKHTFEFPEKLTIAGQEAVAFSVVNVAYDGQGDSDSKETITVPQYTSFATVVGNEQGLSVSFITVTYSINNEIKIVYSFKLNDWKHIKS